MNVKDLSLEDMSANRSTSKSNPTQQLRDAIERHEIVIEIVDTGKEDRVYECSISDWNDRLERERRKGLENDIWNKKNVPLLKDQMGSLGNHHHPNSDYEHEILILDEWGVWKAMKKLIEEMSREVETVLEDGWSPLYEKFKERVEHDFWEMDNLDQARGDRYKIADVCYEILQYAMSHEIDPETAITALELKKDENFGEKIRNAFIKTYDKRWFETIEGAYQAKEA